MLHIQAGIQFNFEKVIEFNFEKVFACNTASKGLKTILTLGNLIFKTSQCL